MPLNLLKLIPTKLEKHMEKLHPKIRNWVLPYWYERQNNPLEHTYAADGTRFVNLTCRSWTSLRIRNSHQMIWVDRLGVIHLPGMGISIEIWVHNGENFYTSGRYKKVWQRYLADIGGIKTVMEFETGTCSVAIYPLTIENQETVQIKINLQIPEKDALKRNGVYLVIRPFDLNGLSVIKQIEYRNHHLRVNDSNLIIFETEPQHCYFINGESGDITQYFKLGEGNTKASSRDGLCTGLVGYSGLPAELEEIHLLLTFKTDLISKTKRFPWVIFPLKTSTLINPQQRIPSNLIQSKSIIDSLFKANLKQLEVFTVPSPQSIDIYQILVLNRFGNLIHSAAYLKQCLKRVGWEGSLSDKFLGPDKIIYAIHDYIRFSEDYRFVEQCWPILKRVAEGLWYRHYWKYFQPKANKYLELSNQSAGFYENFSWSCASLKAMAELSQNLGFISEFHIYKEQYLSLWGKLFGLLKKAVKLDQHPQGNNLGGGAEAVRNLVSSFPLQLWPMHETLIKDSIDYILNHHIYQGGIFSPIDFQGIDLELTARFGQVLIREGYDYSSIINLFLTAGASTWSWPDRINPLTMDGIGKLGHDPQVLFQVLLMVRSIILREEGDFLIILPGLFRNQLWERPHLKLNQLPSYFGTITLNCEAVGEMIQIDFWPEYHLKPQKVIFFLHPDYKLAYVDAAFRCNDLTIEIDPNFHQLRLKKKKSSGLS